MGDIFVGIDISGFHLAASVLSDPVTHPPVLGNISLNINAGTEDKPVKATKLFVDAAQLSGDASFERTEIGRDASTLDKSPEGGRGLQDTCIAASLHNLTNRKISRRCSMTDLSDADGQSVLGWVERVSMFYAEEYGFPPIAGRIVGWLMICEPPEQSAWEMATAIGVSRASLATSLRVLTSFGFVSRHTRPGRRTQFYAVHDSAWGEAIRHHFATLTQFRDITADGLKLAGADSKRAQRLRFAYGAFAQTLDRFADLEGSASAQTPATAEDRP